ncbi:MAG: zinc ribbon domain-containing protein [Lachnospiraceae bacterium]|nr:zinc ribbon domain-containing protein [Lachnospiraceae bacterium]
MYCKNCGTEIKEGGRFCPACGTPVVSSEDSNLMNRNTQPQSMTNVGNTEKLVNHALYSGQATSGALILDSTASIKNEMGYVPVVTWIAVGFCICLMPVYGIGIVLAFCFFPVWGFVIKTVARKKAEKLKWIQFQFVPGVGIDEVISRLQPALISKYGTSMSFERNKNGSVSIIYKGVDYLMEINENATFCIWGGCTNVGRALTTSWYGMYKKMREGIGIIAYELQLLYGIK